MADGGTAAGSWPRFPRELLAALREEAPEGGLLQLGLWHGEGLMVRRVVRETDDGLLAELEPTGSDRAADRGPVVVAVPWHAIARVQVVPAPVHKARTGYVPGS